MQDMALKLSLYFYLLKEKHIGCYFQVWSPNYQGAQCSPLFLYQLFLYPQGDMPGLRKPHKKTPRKASALITATTNIHLPKPVSIDPTIKSDLVLIYPIGKDRVEDWSL